MMNQSLIDWSARLIESYKERIQHEERVIELIEAGKMRSHHNDQDTTAETLEQAKRSIKAYGDGIEIMEQAQAELSTRM